MFGGPFEHNIDPIFAEIGGLYLWWYGLSYSIGFLGVFLWLRRSRASLSMDMGDVYTLTILVAGGVLLGGRLVEVVFYEWAYYGEHPWRVPAIWLGGMSTHGILIGGIAGIWIFCRRSNRSFLSVADVLAIAGAYIMGMGRIGNFIDGQIVGSVTDVWWAVKFPDLEGYRHPVVLYDGIKNLLLIPLLLAIRRTNPPRGVILGHFILWYGFLRIFVDFFREYRTDLFGLPPGQEFNAVMTLTGLVLIVWGYHRRKKAREPPAVPRGKTVDAGGSLGIRLKQCAFLLLLIVPMVIPSDWTQDVPERYGKRHEGLTYSFWYPEN